MSIFRNTRLAKKVNNDNPFVFCQISKDKLFFPNDCRLDQCIFVVALAAFYVPGLIQGCPACCFSELLKTRDALAIGLSPIDGQFFR